MLSTYTTLVCRLNSLCHKHTCIMGKGQFMLSVDSNHMPAKEGLAPEALRRKADWYASSWPIHKHLQRIGKFSKPF